MMRIEAWGLSGTKVRRLSSWIHLITSFRHPSLPPIYIHSLDTFLLRKVHVELLGEIACRDFENEFGVTSQHEE
jgi:hypothetical protein